MLFAIKRHLGYTIATLIVFVVLALWLCSLLALEWNWQLAPNWYIHTAIGILCIAFSDGFFHGLLWLIKGEKYLSRYRCLVMYFDSQKWYHIIFGGLLAGAEELVFRGLLLTGLIQLGHCPESIACIVTGIVFALAHLLPDSRLFLFNVWAVWEGVLLGLVYLISGSIIVAIVVHTVHDILGFYLFAWQRKTGWFMGKTNLN